MYLRTAPSTCFARRLATTLAVVVLAAVATVSVPSAASAGAPVLAGPAHPTFNGIYLTGGGGGNRYAPGAGAVDFFDPVPPSRDRNPTPATVVGESDSTALQGAALLRTDLTGTVLGDLTLDSLRLEDLPVDIPLSTIPIARATGPRTWTELLASTGLAGVPLQNVTWKQVAALSPPPTALAQITLDEVDFTGSALADVPLSALVLGGAAVSTIEIPPQPGQDGSTPLVDRWCALLDATRAGACSDPRLLVGATLLEVGVRGAPLKDIPLKDIPLKDIDLATSPLKDIPLKDIVLDVAPLKDIPLKDIDLATSPLKDIPLKDIDLAASPLKDIPLKDIDLATSPLKDIPLKDIDLATSPLKDIPLKDIDLGLSGLGALPLAQVDWAAAPIGRAGLDQLDLGGSLVGAIPLSATASPANIATCDVPAAWCDATPTIGEAAAAGAVRPGATLADVGAPGFAGAATLADLLAARTAGSALDPTIGDLRPDRVTGGFATALGALLTALDDQVSGVELGDLRFNDASDALLGWVLVFMSDAALAGYLLGDVGTYTDGAGRDITLGDLGAWTNAAGGEITLGQLAKYLDESVSLADVLLALVPPAAFPFEDFPIDSLGFNQGGRLIATDSLGQRSQRTMGFIVLDNLGTEPTEPATLELYLPAGSGFTGQLSSQGGREPNVTNVRAEKLADGRVRIRAALPSLPVTTPDTAVELVFFFDNPIRLGRVTLEASLVAADGSVADTAETGMLLEENVEPNSPGEGGRAAPMPPDPTCSVPSPNCAPLDTEDVDAMVPGFIDRMGDVDWYVMRDVRAGARVAADLTNLPLDADVVLYGPSGIATSPSLFPEADEPLPGRLVEDGELGVGQAASSLSAQALADLQLDQGRVDPRTGTLVPPLTPLSMSLHRGTDAEAVGVVAPVDGDYVVAVSGTSAGVSDEPYLLRTRVTNPSADESCPARTFPGAPTPPSAAPELPSDATALFLTQPGRLAAPHGSSAAQDVAAALDRLVGHLGDDPDAGIRPAVVPLDAYPAIRDAYAAWDAAPCSVAAANAVAAQITGVVRDVRAANPDLAYVTVVGGDDIIPMGRVPDLTRLSNERDYASTFDTRNPISAAEAASFTLTDDVYGATDPVDLDNGGSVFVPRLAVGRLVETPAEITALLDSYSTSGSGALDTSTGLVAGYDFLADGSKVVADRLARPGRTVDRALIDEPGAPPTATRWSRNDLLTKLLPAGDPAPGVTSLNAHFDHTALASSKRDAVRSDDLLTTSDVTAAAGGRLARKVLFTMGCHAGLAVPDAYLPGGAVDPLALDWAQALAAQEVSVYVANTGFGIGDTSAVAYSERLMGLYAKLLDGSVSAGQALAYAKQAYYGSLGAVGVYDVKILQQTTFYGLPFWGVGTSAPVPPPVTAPPSPDGLVVDPATGLASATISVESTFDEVVTARGRYWQVTGPDGTEDPQVTHYRPILPLTSRSVGVDGLVARGALVTSLVDHELAGVDPVLATPTIDLGDSSPEVRVDDATWAPRLATITTSQSPSGPRQDLVVVPGRFTGASQGGGGRQRLYDEVGVQVLYGPGTDTDVAPPEVPSSEGVVTGSTIGFRVAASDASGVRRVVAAFRDVDGRWRFTDLAPSSGGFTGSAELAGPLAAGASVEYFVQAVDTAGNVGLAWNKAAGFAARPTPPQPPDLSVAADAPLPSSGWYPGDVTATASTSPAAPIDWRVDGGPWQPDRRSPSQLGPIRVTVGGEGIRRLDVRAPGGLLSSLAVRIDRSAPVVIVPSAQDFERGQPTRDAFTCADAGSGIATCTSTPIDTSTVTAPGVHRTYTVTAVDRVGRTASTTVTYTVRVASDDVPPTISATVSPAPNAAGWHRTNPTITFECRDLRSGVADGACPAPRTVTAEGVQVESGTVTDRAGNEATTSVTVRLDRTPPVVRLTGVPGGPTCTTTDEAVGRVTSGVATAATLERTTTRVAGLPMTTATCSGARDVAGNTTPPLTRTYVAPLAFSGFQSPVDNPPVVNVGKAGRSYPLKFVLRDQQGELVTTVSAVSRIDVVTVSCTAMDAAGDPLEEQSVGSTGLRWDAVAQQFVDNWKTPKDAGCFRFDVLLADGTAARSALFRLTK